MYRSLSIYRSVHTHIYIYTYTSVYIYLSIYLSVYLSIYLSIHLSIYINIYICIHIYARPAGRLRRGAGRERREDAARQARRAPLDTHTHTDREQHSRHRHTHARPRYGVKTRCEDRMWRISSGRGYDTGGEVDPELCGRAVDEEDR